VSIATVAAIAPSFILDVGLPEKLRTRRLTVFYMLTTTGQIIAGILLGILADWSYERRFFLAAGLIGALAVFFWFVSAEPAKRIQVRKAAPEGEPERTEPHSMRKILISIFGVLLLMAVFAGIGYNAIISQITQIMDETFGITHGTTSFLIAAVGVVNLGGFLVAGKLLGRKGGLASAMSAQALHLSGIVGMLVVSIASPTTAIMAGFFMIVFYLGEPFGRIPQPVVATQFSGMPTSTATGWYLAALAGSATLSGLLAGAIAQEFGYDAILWLATGAFAIAITIGLIFLRPVDLRMRARPMPAGTPADAPR
jgi:predicted MFS family arabinose efflux permease